MIIPAEILEKWTALRDRGDVVDIVKEFGISQPIISKALNDGECSEDTFKALAAFYGRRADLVKNAA